MRENVTRWDLFFMEIGMLRKHVIIIVELPELAHQMMISLLEC